ncbi:MAG: hypothetical protein COW30_10565 [Rhodospirillales bacterium CG15_BIG_FIL_POST_REV_8_21_14_020_66_15]|nr:MAG: hypothetical protein COW30_10565 [Rhodospirillales bacterium CG15_BIG_FIL_POST_REV_8_21_14_020_66_15]
MEIPESQQLAAYFEDLDALPLSTRAQNDADFENLSRWIDSRLAGNGGGTLEWHVILADDDTSNRLVIGSLLEKSGLTVTAVENGSQAIDVLNDGKQVDLFLLDINMPVMDGLEAARTIRARPDVNADLTLIAITSDVSPVRIAAMREAGFDICMAKPVRRDNLFRVILGSLSRRAAV